GGPDQVVRLLGAVRGPQAQEAMRRDILRRLGFALVSLFLLSVTIFFFVRVTGDPAVLLTEPGASQADLDAIRQQFGLDQPLGVLGSEYVKLARLKGLPEALVIAKHAFKNALIPVLTLAGINLVLMVNVAVVVETVFAWPGVGRLLYEGIAFRDFPVVQATVLLGGAMIVIVNLLVDILYAVIDPRIRYER